jgi:hypothetical protein
MPNAPQPRRHGRGLGWKPGRGTAPDRYPMRAALEDAPPAPPTRAWWSDGAWLDQGGTSQCTIYSWAHLLADGPLTQTGLVRSFGPDGLTRLYEEGQGLDGTPTSERDSGLTTDAAAKVIRAHGWIQSYHWAASADDVLDAILRRGPVTLGLDWREPMFEPAPVSGLVRYTGAVAGGHQVVLDAVSRPMGVPGVKGSKQRRIRVKGSWGRSFGRKGFCSLLEEDLYAIMANGGEACLAVEVKAHA